MLARLELIGNLTADPEVKSVTVRGESRKVTEFSVAVNDPFNKEKPASFFNNIAAWNGTGESIAKYVKKGDRVFVVADAEMRSDEKDGVKRNHLNLTVKDVRFLASKTSEGNGRYDSAPPSDSETETATPAEAPAETPDETPAPEQESLEVPF